MRSIEAAALRRTVAAIFEAAGCSAVESARVAESLVETNLTGHDSHGVIRVPRYIAALKRGDVHAGRGITIVTETPVLAVVDGNNGFGQTIAQQATDLGIGKATTSGMAIVALRHTAHVGRIGEWAERAAAAGLISIHFVNVPGSILVAPFNGVERRMSTNPIAIGIPVTGELPIVLDFATSTVAEGKALVAYKGGAALPPDALVEPDGRTTGDPAALYGTPHPGKPADARDGPGAIRAFGQHKGSGLSFMCELLAGAFSGGGTAASAHPSITNAMLSIYLAPSAFGDARAFTDEVRAFAAFFTSSRPAVPGTEVLMPGGPEQRSRERRRREGIPLEDAVWEGILQAAESCGLSREHMEHLLSEGSLSR
ncbi:malate/lactate/ureidoglycolate dehydrogenase [bacterium]|nr:MAG: malate/lactate/ureidoglycolate dehydrogenase [bacterium]